MAEQNTQEDPSKMLVFKEWVPYRFRFWIYLTFLTIFQFSNGVYFGCMSQMSGELGITQSDTLMLSYAVLIGLTMYFPLAFRLKFRFPNRTNLIVAATVLMICNLIVPRVNSMPVLVTVCFIAGFFRLYGTFECLSNIIFKITPSYNYAVFLSFVFFVVIGVVQVHDVTAGYITYFYNWKYVHLAAAGLLLLVMAGAFILMRPHRAAPVRPLQGIDWLGMVLWTIFILLAIFIAQYGEQLGWFASPHIRACCGAALIALGANIWRMRAVEHPFLEFGAFRSKNLWWLLLAFLVMDLLLSTQHVLQNIFTSAVMQYDYLTTTSLKWFEFLGVLLGAIFCWQYMLHTKGGHFRLMYIGMISILLYIASFYFILSPSVNVERLYLPLILAGFGHVLIFISLTVYANKNVAFTLYFQVLCILGFIRMGVAAPIGNAVYSRAMTAAISSQLGAIGSSVNLGALPYAGFDGVAYSQVASAVSSQAILSALRELLGYSVIFGVGTLAAVLAVKLFLYLCRYGNKYRRPRPEGA